MGVLVWCKYGIDALSSLLVVLEFEEKKNRNKVHLPPIAIKHSIANQSNISD